MGRQSLEYKIDIYDAMLLEHKSLHTKDNLKWENMFTLSSFEHKGHYLRFKRKRLLQTTVYIHSPREWLIHRTFNLLKY